MKKFAIFGIFILLMITFISPIYATEETPVPEHETIENTEEASTTTIQVTARILEAGEPKQVQTGSITDTVQEVKIEILEGAYENEEFTTNYNLSYDIDGKILGYELEVGDKVTVQIVEDENGNVAVTVQELSRNHYIIIMMGLFLLSIVLVGGKQGVKAIIGLVITILAVYFILIQLLNQTSLPLSQTGSF